MGYHYRSKCLTTRENSLATPLHFLTMQNQDRSQSATNPEFPALVSVGGRDLALQKLTAELDLGEMSANTFSVLVSSARRRVAA